MRVSFDCTDEIEGPGDTDEVSGCRTLPRTGKGARRIINAFHRGMIFPRRRFDAGGRKGPFLIETGNNDMVGMAGEGPQHRSIFLVRKDAEDNDEPAVGERAGKRPAERGDSRRIVRPVKDHKGIARRHFQPPLPGDPCEPLPHCIVADCKTSCAEYLHGAQGTGGVDGLMAADEGEREIPHGSFLPIV